ncbi:MAG: hypothetical protein AAFY70_11210, partial [Bacteroidota bacterium]
TEKLQVLFPLTMNAPIHSSYDMNAIGETEKAFVNALVRDQYISVKAGARPGLIQSIPNNSKLQPYLVGTEETDKKITAYFASTSLILKKVTEVRKGTGEGTFKIQAITQLFWTSPIGQCLNLKPGKETLVNFEVVETSNGWRLSTDQKEDLVFTPAGKSKWGKKNLETFRLVEGFPHSIAGTWVKTKGKWNHSWTFHEDSTYTYYNAKKEQSTNGKFRIQFNSIRLLPEKGPRQNLYIKPSGQNQLWIAYNTVEGKYFSKEGVDIAADAVDEELTQCHDLLLGTWTPSDGEYVWEFSEEQAVLQIKKKKEVVTVSGPWELYKEGAFLYVVLNKGTTSEHKQSLIVKPNQLLRDEYFSYRLKSFYKSE